MTRMRSWGVKEAGEGRRNWRRVGVGSLGVEAGSAERVGDRICTRKYRCLMRTIERRSVRYGVELIEEYR